MARVKKSVEYGGAHYDINPEEAERIQNEAHRRGKRASEVCPMDHSGIRGRYCTHCGTYFRGDDMG